MLYTSRVSYNGVGRLDITVKGQDSFGVHFAPTWKMVMDYKSDKNIEVYSKKYMEILAQKDYQLRYLAAVANDRKVVLVCYCKNGDFCHRVLLAQYLCNKYNVKYIGEIV